MPPRSLRAARPKAGQAGQTPARLSSVDDSAPSLPWATEEQARQAEERRQELLEGLDGRIRLAARETKPHCGDLSPGCRLCVQGLWSCLFITGRCNGRCFFCPAEQQADDPPMTNGLVFPRPEGYLEYLELTGYRGVGLSGGEPLLAPGTTLEYLSAIKQRFGGDIYVWLYTNGTLADDETLRRLAEAGLDEIRFDIAATGYDLARARAAVRVIKRVTVEIPAIPEDVPRMKRLLPLMRDAGINYLNLHQLRLTPFNAKRLASRGYTFVPGQCSSVLESELAALELLRCSAEDIGLAVNYCSFVYRSRFQAAAARTRSAELIKKGFESLTQTGLLRSLSLKGPAEALAKQAQGLAKAGADPTCWIMAGSGQGLFVHPSLWSLIDWDSVQLTIGYHATRFIQSLSYLHPFKELPLGSGESFFVERIRQGPPLTLSGHEARLFQTRFLLTQQPFQAPQTEIWLRLQACEEIPCGLQDYGLPPLG